MTKYNISAFIQLMQNALIENDKQESAGRFLLDSIAIIEGVDVSKDMISNLIKRKNDIHNKIKKASARIEVEEAVIAYFEDDVVMDLNPNLVDDICSEIIHLLAEDDSVPVKKQEEIAAFYHADEIGEFLARSFLYAVSRPNKQVESYTEVEDVALLLEVSNQCPRCHQPLTKEIKGQSVRKYEIAEIYPKNQLKAYNNKIALCVSCSLEHQAYSVELSDELFDLKADYVKHASFKEKMSKAVLESEVKEVIFAIVAVGSDAPQGDFKLDVMTIDKKIHPNNVFLLKNLKNDVLEYYYFIQNILSNANIFEDVALSIKKAYRQIEKIYTDQGDIVYHLADWVFHKINLSKPAHRRACDIIIAFFVQNCEVFDEIAE